MARSVRRMFSGFRCFGSLPFGNTQLKTQCPSVFFRTTSERTVVQVLPSIFSRKPRDFSLPNSSWGEEMMRLYNYYNSQSGEATEGQEDHGEQWTRLPSYNRSLKYATGTSANWGVLRQLTELEQLQKKICNRFQIEK
ncbi:hypothetical protein ILYODFUR_017826 [Ilyodon furcidens]|uniref:Uncharacterized protein n=1 Tax=Ilyodon furcidens TaxID=33524 RepID=A0ABV0UJS3_9TELE